MWLETVAGYISTDQSSILDVSDSGGGVWIITVVGVGGGSRQLNGTWANQSDAMEAARELVGGVDPATYGD